MSGILWLASFPKSGNTWLRAFLANYLADTRSPVDINTLPDFAYGDMRVNYYAQVSGRPADVLSWDEINTLRPKVHRFLAASRPGAVFVKTHTALTTIKDVPTVTPEATLGALYVVRNPFDVAISFAHHYGLTLDDGVKALCFRELQIEPKAGHILQPISDWSTHVASWLRTPGLRLQLLRYEDMLASPQTTFGRVLDFLQVPRDRERLKRAIRHSSFRVLAEQERQSGFVERSRNAERFFRSGASGGFRQILTDVQIAALVEYHQPMLQELSYLDSEGRLRI
ncbi:MAG: sulfotransferase domain-containing protein [Defluviicoccus sp.]|nr:MAG: sulfotransferase domain-containing protein [Defluviicoccus sp.]